jgi:hypothetical protein
MMEPRSAPFHKLVLCRELRNLQEQGHLQGLFMVRGIVVSRRTNKFFVTFTIDDSTALLDIAWPYMTPQHTPLPTSSIPSAPYGEMCSPADVPIGSYLVARGVAHTYRGRVELKAFWVEIDSDPNAEAAHLLELCARE